MPNSSSRIRWQTARSNFTFPTVRGRLDRIQNGHFTIHSTLILYCPANHQRHPCLGEATPHVPCNEHVGAKLKLDGRLTWNLELCVLLVLKYSGLMSLSLKQTLFLRDKIAPNCTTKIIHGNKEARETAVWHLPFKWMLIAFRRSERPPSPTSKK